MIYELRHYVAAEGQSEALAKRFSEHVFPLMKRHGLVQVNYWESADGTGEIWYVMEWADAAAMTAGWNRFRADPAWIAAKALSEVDGPLVLTSRSVLVRRPAYAKR